MDRSVPPRRVHVPLVLVSASSAQRRSQLTAQAFANLPEGSTWGLLLSSRLAVPPPWLSGRAVARLSGCPCCMGAMPLLAAYTGLVRSIGPLAGLVIELDAHARLCPMIDLVRSRAVRSTGLELGEVWCAVQDRDWPDRPRGPDDERVVQMLAAADRLWVVEPELRTDIEMYLRHALWSETVAWEGGGVPDWTPAQQAQAPDETDLSDNKPADQTERWTPIGAAQSGVLWRWCAHPQRRFDRRRLEQTLSDLGPSARLKAARAVFQTEREWYQWQPGEPLQPSFWRRDSRLDVMLDEGAPPAHWAAALAACAQ